MEQPLKTLNDLGTRVARDLDVVRVDAEERHALRMRLGAATRTRAPAPRPWLRRSLALAIVVVAAGFAFWSTIRRPLRFSYADGGDRVSGQAGAWITAGERGSNAVEFSDGSRVVLSSKTRVRVPEIGRAGATMVLEEGKAAVAIVPRLGGRWSVAAGPFTVHVTGTRFEVGWDPAAQNLNVDLYEGHVVVSGCALGEGRDLYVGETLTASCKDGSTEIRKGAAPIPIASDTAQTALEARAVPTPPAVATADLPPPRTSTANSPSPAAERLDEPPTAWRALLRSAQFGDAVTAAVAIGFGGVCDTASAEDLLALADAARLSQDGGHADQAYRAVRARFPRSGPAQLAAFGLARLAFDRQDYAAARQWLRSYLREAPSGPLSREARGRLMESTDKLGDQATARALAEDYLRRYPDGPYSQMATRLSAP